MVLFHEGCHGCTKQKLVGIDNCVKCCYFRADWKLPNLNNNVPKVDFVRMKLKVKHNMPLSDRETYMLCELKMTKFDLIETAGSKGIANYIRGLLS